MDVHVHLRNSHITNAYNPQPHSFLNYGYTWERRNDESSRFPGQLDVAALASSPAMITSDRQRVVIPEEMLMHHPLLLTAEKPLRPGFADGAGGYPYAAAAQSPVPAALGTSIRRDGSLVGMPFSESYVASKILGDQQISMGRIDHPLGGMQKVAPAAATTTMGSMYSFDHRVRSASQEYTSSFLRVPGRDHYMNSMYPVLRAADEVQRTPFDPTSQMWTSLEHLSEASYRSSAVVGGLGVTQLPQKTHTAVQSTAISKRRKFQYKWERDDSWSRDEYDEDDQDTASTEVENLQVGGVGTACVPPTDQTRHTRDSWNPGKQYPSGDYRSKYEETSGTRSSLSFPEQPIVSEACASATIPKSFAILDAPNAGLSTTKRTTEHAFKSDHCKANIKPKLALVPEKSDLVASSSEEMMIWPPAVVIYNTRTDKTGELWDGMGGKEMDTYLNGLGHVQGKSKPLWGKKGHKGLVIVKYKPNLSGLREAERLHKHFEENGRGRMQWLQISSDQNTSSDDQLEDGADFVYVDPQTKESKRILYGFLAGPSDVKNFDHASKIKFSVQSKSEVLSRQQLLEKAS